MIERKSMDPVAERFPLCCQWELTCLCNLHCVMCYTDCFNRPERLRQELSTDEILRILGELADAGCLELTLTGGEPFARPDFLEIYEHAKRRGFLVNILTNATLITEAVADRLAALPPQRIEISMHGLTERTFEAVTQGQGSFARCMRAIRLLLERKQSLVIKTTAMTANKDEILAIKGYVESLGSVGYRLGEDVRLALDGSDAPQRLALSEAERRRIKEQDPQLWAETCARESEELGSCQSGKRRFHIDAYGGLQLCSGNRRQSYDLRKGSFAEGFYRALPTFGCPFKADAQPSPIEYRVSPVRAHA